VKQLSAVQFQPGKPFWFTLPEPLGFGRTICVTLMLADGRKACFNNFVSRFELQEPRYMNIMLAEKIQQLQRAMNNLPQ